MPVEAPPEPHLFVPLTIRELRRNQAFAPGGPMAGQLVQRTLRAVHGAALALTENDPAKAEAAAIAVFRAFAARHRRLPRKTLIPSWLLRSAVFASRKLHRPPAPSPLALVLRKLFRLHPRYRDPLILRHVFHEESAAAARALRVSEKRFNKNALRAITKLTRACQKKSGIQDPLGLLRAIATPLPPEMEATVIQTAAAAPARADKRERLVRGTLRSWRWLALRRGFFRALRALAGTVCVLLLLALTIFLLARAGFIHRWGMQLAAKGLVKEFPGIAQPARAWPTNAADQKLARQNPPRDAADLFTMTNIWTARLAFTPEQWRTLQPGRVPPILNVAGGDGKFMLRNPKAKRSGIAGVFGFEFDWSEASLQFSGTLFEKIGVRYRGNGTFLSSLYGHKQSLKLDLNRYDKDQNLAGEQMLNLVNSLPDNSYVHDALAERLFRDLGVPAPRTSYAYVTIDAPPALTNQPLGLYVLIEDIDTRFAHDRFGTKKVPIFKPVTYDLFKDLGNDWRTYADIYDLKTKATDSDLQRVIDFARLVTHASDDEFAQHLPDFLDLKEFAAFLAGHVLLSSYDGFLNNGQNYYFYIDPRSNRIGFISWDQDHSWGEFGYAGTIDQREHASIWHPATYNFEFLNRVLEVPAFHEIYRQTLERGMSELFTKERLYAQIDQLASVIRPAIAAENDFRLKRFDQAVSSQWLPGPRDNRNLEGPKAPVHQIKRFIENRIQSVHDQLDGKSEGALFTHEHRRRK